MAVAANTEQTPPRSLTAVLDAALQRIAVPESAPADRGFAKHAAAAAAATAATYDATATRMSELDTAAAVDCSKQACSCYV